MRLSKKLAAVAIAAGVALTASAAFAYWTSTGSGSGSATSGDASAWAVTSDPATGDALTPGGPVDNIAYHVANDSSGHQQLDSVAISVDSITMVDGLGHTVPAVGCAADDFTIGTAAAGDTFTVNPHVDLAPANLNDSDTYSNDVDLQMINRADGGTPGAGNQDGCKNVTVNLKFDAS